jgi:hypothetical protein
MKIKFFTIICIILIVFSFIIDDIKPIQIEKFHKINSYEYQKGVEGTTFKDSLDRNQYLELLYTLKLYPITEYKLPSFYHEKELLNANIPRELWRAPIDIVLDKMIYIYIFGTPWSETDSIHLYYLTERPNESFFRIEKRYYQLKSKDVEKLTELLTSK